MSTETNDDKKCTLKLPLKIQTFPIYLHQGLFHWDLLIYIMPIHTLNILSNNPTHSLTPVTNEQYQEHLSIHVYNI